MRVVVTGGRTFNNRAVVNNLLDTVHQSFGPITTIISGHASGADGLAEQWARANNVPIKPYTAEWKRYGRRAGPIRNQRMLDEGRPHTVVAFPGGKGTADMVRRALAAGLPVIRAEGVKL
jgi:predicted Rossmann-fold nucleotide-binding protein